MFFFNSSRCPKFNKFVPSLKNVNGNVKFVIYILFVILHF